MHDRFIWIINNIGSTVQDVISQLSNFSMIRLIIVDFRSYVLAANNYIDIFNCSFLPFIDCELLN